MTFISRWGTIESWEEGVGGTVKQSKLRDTRGCTLSVATHLTIGFFSTTLLRRLIGEFHYFVHVVFQLHVSLHRTHPLLANQA